MTFDLPVSARAGFWRRAFASLLDVITIYVPFQLIISVLFVATAGHIQMSSPVAFYGECSEPQTMPDGLMPPPPAGSNFIRDCNIYFLGAQTARILQVGRLNIEGTSAQSVSRSYMLDRDGHLINGVSVDWIAILALIAYLVAMETRTGVTLGSRAMRIRVIDSATPVGPGVPLRKIVLRYLAMLIGILPILVLILAVPLIYGSDLEQLAKFLASSFFLWVFIGGYIVGTGWAILLIVQVANKRDPLYDRIAGTAVLRASHDHGNHTR
jgi:uncharacterized RDD family membrane protein YckC